MLVEDWHKAIFCKNLNVRGYKTWKKNIGGKIHQFIKVLGYKVQLSQLINSENVKLAMPTFC